MILRSKIQYIQTIQNWWKTHKVSNHQDPILNVPWNSIPINRLYKHVSYSGKIYAFDAPTLLHSFEVSGNTTNPLTRQQFNDIEIKRLFKKSGRPDTEFKTIAYFNNILN